MARIHKEKGGSLRSSQVQKKSKTKAFGSESSLKDQIVALGGDARDLELIKGAEDGMDVEESGGNNDPELAKDVSNFLKELKIGGDKGKGKEVQKEKGKGKEKGKEKQKEKQPATVKEDGKEKAGKANGPAKSEKKPTKKVFNDDISTRPNSNKAAVLPTSKLNALVDASVPTKSPSKSSSTLLVDPTSHWYAVLLPLPPASSPIPTPTPAQLSSLQNRAQDLYTTALNAYSSQTSSQSSGDAAFMAKVIQSGTLSDKLSALTLMLQGAPMYNTKSLETLLGMAEKKGGREERLKAVRCVVDWWVGGGCPDRKLRYFRDQPLLHPNLTDQYLVLWHFEDYLKKTFFSFLQTLETLSLDPLPYVRTQTLTFIFTLLRDKSEQEQNLLRLLVNKLGDTERSVCSRVSYYLLQLMQAHPSMKAIVIKEMKDLVFKASASTSATAFGTASAGKHIRFDDGKKKGKQDSAQKAEGKKSGGGPTHARYYATITFNQIVLSPSVTDREVARDLISIYFEMFRELLGEKDEGELEEVGSDDEDTQGRKGDRKKSKKKEVKGEAGFSEVEDSKSRLISQILTGVNRALPFAKFANEDAVFKKHIDTLFLITHTSTFNISLQSLLLLLQITKSLSSSNPIVARYYRTLYASLFDSRLHTSNKQAMYLNLLFKSLKEDRDNERVAAFLRRLGQVLVEGVGGGMEFVAGGLYLIGELFSTIPNLRDMVTASRPSSSKADSETVQDEYDPRKRDPQYAHAFASPLWELLPLTNHYHPTISLHARQLVSGQALTATPDLSLNTLSHFLDRFVYKNPKKSQAKAKGASAMQPAASTADGSSGVKLLKGEVNTKEGPVNDEAFWKRRAENVPVDQLFFHKFFNKKSEMERSRAVKKGKRKGGDGDEDSDADMGSEDEIEEAADAASDAEEESEVARESEEEDNSDREEQEIWKAMKSSMHQLRELDDAHQVEDSDELPSDLDADEPSEDGSGPDQDANEDGDGDGDGDEGEGEDEDEDEADAFSLAEGSDDDDLVALDDDMSVGLIEYDGSDQEEEWAGINDASSKKRKRGEEKKGGRKKLRSLPTFASYEDYAKMIDDGPEDNI